MSTPTLSRSRILGIAVLTGVLLGGLGAYADTLWYGLLSSILNLIGNSGAGWVLGAVIMGFLGARLRYSMLAGLTTMHSAVGTYYGAIIHFDLRETAAMSTLLETAGMWALVALVVGPASGALGWTLVRAPSPYRQISGGVTAGLIATTSVYWVLASVPYLTRNLRDLSNPDFPLLFNMGVIVAAFALAVSTTKGARFVGIPACIATVAFGVAAFELLQGLLP